MTRIRNLTRVDQVKDGDEFPIYQSDSGRTRSVDFGTMRDEISSTVDAATAVAVAAAAAAEEAAASADATILRADLADSADLVKGASIVARSSVTVESLAELAGLTQNKKLVANLQLGGRSGTFYWDGSDLSAEVAADTLQGVYVAPTSDATGASGAWVRQYGQSVNRAAAVIPEWYVDVIGAGSKDDDTAAFRAALASGKNVDVVYSKTYLLKSDTSPLSGGPYQSYCLQTSAANQIITFKAAATLKQADANNAVVIYMGHDYCEIVNDGAAIIDGNRANQTDHPTANDVIRSSATTGCKTYRVKVRNAASAGIKFDDCDDAFHWKPDVENCARNGIFHYGNRNVVLFPRVVDTEDGEFANGIFFTASPSSTTTSELVYDNVCIGFYVERAGDIGVESGIRCVNTLIADGTIKDSHNQGVIIRDNIKPRVHNVRIQCKTGGNIESAITVDSQLFKANPADPNAIVDAGGGTISGVISSNIGLNGSGYEIEVEGINLDDDYAEGRANTGGSAFNIKSSNVSGDNIRSKNIGNHIRLAGNATLSNVNLTSGHFKSVGAILKIEQLVEKSSIFDQKGTAATANVVLSGAGDVKGVRLHGVEDYDSPKRPISNASKFITARSGFYAESPATQFGFTAILSGLQSAVYAVKASNGESATFVVDGAGQISFLIESASIGPAGSAKAYRVELQAGEIILKRYEVALSITYFTFCRLV